MVPKRGLEESLRLFPRSKWNQLPERVGETFLYCLFPKEATELPKEAIYWWRMLFVSITGELEMAGSYIQFVPCLLSTWCRFPMFLLWGQEDLRVFTGISKSPHIQTFFYEELIIDFFSLAIWKWALNINFSLRHVKSSSFDFPPFLQFYDWILKLFWRCSILGFLLLFFFIIIRSEVSQVHPSQVYQMSNELDLFEVKWLHYDRCHLCALGKTSLKP